MINLINGLGQMGSGFRDIKIFLRQKQFSQNGQTDTYLVPSVS